MPDVPFPTASELFAARASVLSALARKIVAARTAGDLNAERRLLGDYQRALVVYGDPAEIVADARKAESPSPLALKVAVFGEDIARQVRGAALAVAGVVGLIIWAKFFRRAV